MNNINKYASIILIIGVVYLVYLTISLFITSIREPFAEILAQALVYGDVYSENDSFAWLTVLFKITGFMTATCFIVLGTYIQYYKSMVKVETM